jgi:hypothetical protein
MVSLGRKCKPVEHDKKLVEIGRKLAEMVRNWLKIGQKLMVKNVN